MLWRYPKTSISVATAVGAFTIYRAWTLASGAADTERVGYAPLATLKPIYEGLWIVDDVMSASGLAMSIRMTVLRLANGDVLLYSPTPYNGALAKAIETIGTVRYLIAPTFAHWTHLAEWQDAYPDAKTWGVPGLRDRSQVIHSDVHIDMDLPSVAPPPWRAEITMDLIAGAGGFCECYFFHEASRTLLLCDLIQNLRPRKLPPFTRFIAKAFLGTRATTALHVRATLLAGGKEAKQAVAAMVALEPDRVIFAHGDPFEEDAAQRLREAFAWLV